MSSDQNENQTQSSDSPSELLDAEERELFEKIPSDGESIGNKRLRGLSKWTEEKYWTVRSRLVDKNYVQIGMGRGGSVFRLKEITPPTSQSKDETAQPPESARSPEQNLYEPVMECLEKWSKEVNLSNYFIEKTAFQGSKKTGGTWTRPDIVIINVETYQFIPNKFLEVMTFEVKPADSWEIQGVFEAAAHSRFATRSYIVLHYDEKNPPSDESYDRITSECQRFGIGMIVFKNPKDYDTYEFQIEPIRRQSDPAEIDTFIEKQISPINKGKLSRWLR